MVRIIGNGISAIICAICLDKLDIEYTIHGSGVFNAPELLYLKNDKYHLFDNYPKELVKIGYIDNDGSIQEKLNQKLQALYLSKQNRQVTSSAISDGTSSFEAINLKQIYEDFDKTKIIDERISPEVFTSTFKDDIILNTVIPFDKEYKPSYLYIKKMKNELSGFTYLYDCRKNDIKRWTKNTIEFISPQEGTIAIPNYYDEPEIKEKGNVVYISRNASQSQIKVEDIIDYIFKRFSNES